MFLTEMYDGFVEPSAVSTLQGIFYTVISLLIPVIVGLFKKKVDVDRDGERRKRIDELIEAAVADVEQTYAGDLKKRGVFNGLEAKEALKRAADLVEALMSKKLWTYLRRKYNDPGKWLRAKIHRYVLEQKYERKQAEYSE